MTKILCSVFCAFLLSACGGDKPDYESCVTVNGKTTCCSTWCEDGKKCTTTCV